MLSRQESLWNLMVNHVIHVLLLRAGIILLVFFASVTVLISGCVTPAYYEYDASFSVHRIFERSLSGVESVVTIVSPTVSSDSAKAYPDTLKYIIVNGDTAYRHPVPTLSPVFDSAAPYHTDGTINFVTLVYDSLTILDTTYEAGLTATINAPMYGDTIQRANGLNVSYQTNAGSASSLRCFLQISDSSTFYSNDVLLGSTGTIDFPASNLAALHSGILWADLQVGESATDYFITYITYYEIIVEHQVIMDHIVAYALH
jgi:hypothetical protein